MRYKESREQSAELLRMVLPLMARHGAGFHPLSYAVWYEYAAGCNPGLSGAVDAVLARDQTLTDRDIESLFDRFVAMRDIESSARMRAEIEHLMHDVDGATNEVGAEVCRYGKGLDEHRRMLSQATDPGTLHEVVGSLIEDTVRVRGQTERFQEHLKKSSEEVVRLREELELVQGLALCDPLTGLLNRRGFDQQAQKLSRGGAGPCSLLMVDIDHFKAVNDSHGHLLGDKVLIAVANVLRTCVGERGSVARIGGEEFAVLLGQCPLDSAAALAERIRASIEGGKIRRADSNESIGNVTVSVGVACAAPQEAFDAVVVRADRALYQSKSAGRNRVTVAEQPSTAAA